jgi:excisionase family DNA binding protein
VTPGPEADESTPSGDLLNDVSTAAQQLREMEEHHRAAALRLADALLTAHRGGHSWTEVARAADLGSGETARTRAYRARDNVDVPPSVRWRQERASAEQPRAKSRAPGLSVTEAAKRLDVSRKTVYARIRSGKLSATTDDAGRTRVLLDED